jgi:predicted small secreted protein
MKESDYKNMIIVSCFAALIIFSVTGCKTVNGLKEDVYDARKSVSDFVSPSEPLVKEEKKVD